MIFRCVARKINGYPLSLLEIHITVQVLRALEMYFLWWEVICNNSEFSGLTVKRQKPVDIIKPTIIPDRSLKNVQDSTL